MNTYERLIRQEKRYRAGLQLDYPIMFIVPILVIGLFIMYLRSGSSRAEKLESFMHFAVLLLIYGGVVIGIRFFDKELRKVSDVESDFDMLRIEAGALDDYTFNEMLEKMVCYWDHIFIGNGYFIDFRLLSVIRIKNIVRVQGTHESVRSGKHHRTIYYVIVYTDVPLKIRCKNQRRQAELLRALNLALIEKDYIPEKRKALPQPKREVIQTSGDAEMDEI